MPKNKFQDVVFTAIMATIMVYGMVVYNVALNMGKVTGETFLAAVHELPIKSFLCMVLQSMCTLLLTSRGGQDMFWSLLSQPSHL